jgi:hypothetical protein
LARRNLPSLWTRTFPLANRSATVATVSFVFLVQELTARTRSPKESFGRGFKIWLFFFIALYPFDSSFNAFVQSNFVRHCHGG